MLREFVVTSRTPCLVCLPSVFWMMNGNCEEKLQLISSRDERFFLRSLTLYTLISVSIFSILFTIFFHLALAMRICLTIQASFGNYFLCSCGLNK